MAQILFESESLVISKVLYSGSHCGDWIVPDEFPKLRHELSLLAAQGDEALVEFANAMQDLLEAGEAQGNPIVYTLNLIPQAVSIFPLDFFVF